MNSGKITLLVLAAGMGSRYGGLKQLDELGPNGETIIEYSIYDAIKVGFDRVVFVIRDFFADDFKQSVSNKFSDLIEVDYVYQDVNVSIPGVKGLTEREKPWGTAHAVLVADQVIQEPFAVINADDYYGKTSFQQVAGFLRNEVEPDYHCLVGYLLENTLSEKGHVNRGICEIGDSGHLKKIVERLKISRDENGQINATDDLSPSAFPERTVVSMNFWGFHPSIFTEFKRGFIEFAKKNKDNPRAEFLIPSIVDELISSERMRFKVLTSKERWFGVTYKEDASRVRRAFEQFQNDEYYTSPLFMPK